MSKIIEGLELKRFGKLTVIKKVGKLWECKCDCGKTRSFEAGRLGHATSCGCKKRMDLAGQKFSRLTVLRKVGKSNGHVTWECRCDCGKIVVKIGTKLVGGRCESCGCKKREDAINRQWKGYGEISGSLWRRITDQAKLRNFEVTITIKDAWDLFLKQNRKCNLTGLPLVFASSYLAIDGTASLDRIDSKLGYTKNNIQWVHKNINQMKSNFTEEYFVELCRRVLETHNAKGK